MEDKLRENAEQVVNKFGKSKNNEFGFNPASITAIEDFLEEQRTRNDLTKENVDAMVSSLGSYLGECIIRCYGGEWKEMFGSWAVAFDENYAAFPFSEVRKQIERGREGGEGIQGFFNSIPILFGIQLKETPCFDKKWWKFW